MLLPALRGGLEQDVTRRDAAAVPLDRPDLPDERRLLRRLPAGAAAAVRAGRRPRGVRARAGRLLDRRADDVLGAAGARRTATGADAASLAEHLRICVSGGAPMPADVLRRFEHTFGVRVLEGYGLSETSPVVCFNQLQKPSKPGTVGLPIFGVDVRCVDEEGMPVAPGERGEIVVRGPNVMKGYYNRPDATARRDAQRLVPHRATSASSTPTATCRSSIARRT